MKNINKFSPTKYPSLLGRTCKNIIMSPIFYANGPPHIGHLYTAFLCDGMSRFHRHIMKESTFFAIGTDEHGNKIQKKAESLGFKTKQLCDYNSDSFKEIFAMAGIQYD